MVGSISTPSRTPSSFAPARSFAGREQYFPALDGLRAFSVLFVIYEHITAKQSALRHFHGWLGVDVFFVLSGFLITGLLLREEQLQGSVDMAAFYIRRAFRILPIYWLVLAAYVLMLQPSSKHIKWTQMVAALPYFLTFNNDIPLLLMPDRVGTIFGLSWTLGIEEKFYFLWPILCFVLLKTLRSRWTAGLVTYGSALLLAFVSFKMGRAYSGLIVGALLAMLFASDYRPRLAAAVRKLHPLLVLGIVVMGFALVDLNIWFVFLFSWIITLLISSLILNPSWLGRFLSHPLLVWFGKRSYAMYLIQGFATQALMVRFKPQTALQEVVFALAIFGLASLGASVLRVLIEEPARRLGKKIVAYRRVRRGYLKGVQVSLVDPNLA